MADKLVSTTIHHPALPVNATLIERIVLPTVFAIVTGVVKNPEHAASLKEYLLSVRDAISATYPGE